MKILITGITGYIGSHTAIEILKSPKLELIGIDNLSNSSVASLDRIEQISGRKPKFYEIDLCDKEALANVFEKEKDIAGIIHFAALKAVGESVEQPLRYYHNNLESLVNLLAFCKEYKVNNFIFSSSCSLYGNVSQLPVNEDTPLSETESPYAHTKLVGEKILRAFTEEADTKICALRYFNPVGAHESGLNGELPIGKPNNLVPVITQTASGMISKMTVFGTDYPTRDGSCVRDYIHVTDIAEAHVKALNYLVEEDNSDQFELFNLGSGNGVTVIEAIEAFEKVSGLKLNYELGPPRPGDVAAIYSDSSKAESVLEWVPKRDLENMMSTAWKWQQMLNES